MRRGELPRILKNIIKGNFGKLRRRIASIFTSRRQRYIQRVIDAMVRASYNYVPRVYPGRITYFLSERRVEWFPGSAWYKLAEGGLDLHVTPGGHTEMWKEPHVRVLAEQLKACMDKAHTDNPGL